MIMSRSVKFLLGLSTLICLLPLPGHSEGSGADWPILIHKSGLKSLKPKDISLVFYVTVANKGTEPLTTGLEMERCCQEIDPNDIDCESMVLHSGLRVLLIPNGVRNLTMYFNNLYLHGRSGYCWLRLRWRGQGDPKTRFNEGDRFKVPFDTTLPKPNLYQSTFSRDPDQYSLCSFVDEDPRNACQRVNCLIKYNGFRSFFNWSAERCQKTPSCFDPKTFSPEEELKSHLMLSPVSNKCKNINSGTGLPDDLKGLSPEMTEVGALSFRSYPYKFDCVHGQKSDAGSEPGCRCEPGWTNKDFPAKTFNPALETFAMCNSRSLDGEHEDKAYNASVSFLVLIFLIGIFLLLLCIAGPILWRRRKRRQSYERLSSELSSPSASDDVIAEVKGRREIVLPPAVPFQTREEYRDNMATDNEPLLAPYPSRSRPQHNYNMEVCVKAKPLFLRFPKKLECLPESPECHCLTTVSSDCGGPVPAKTSWSVPSANGNICQNCVLDKPRVATTSMSVDCFPRRLELCACCDEPLDMELIDLNDNDDHRYPTRRLPDELMEVTGTWSPQGLSSLSRSSSTLTTLTEFWRSDYEPAQSHRAAMGRPKPENKVKQFWVDPFFNSFER